MTDSNQTQGCQASCPKCGEAISLEGVAFIPDSQRMSFKITTESAMVGAEGLGEMIANFAKLQKTVAKEYGVAVEIFIESIANLGNGWEITLVIMRKKAAKKGAKKP